MYSNLIKHIGKYIELDDNSIEVLKKYIVPQTYKKKEFLHRTNYSVCYGKLVDVRFFQFYRQ